MPEQTDSRSGRRGQVGGGPCRRRIHDDRIVRGQEPRAADSTTGSLHQSLPIDIEEEVSWVLHEFLRQGSPINSVQRRNITTRVGKTATHPEYFSDLRYRSVTTDGAGTARKRQRSTSNTNSGLDSIPSHSGPFIEVTYLFDKVLSLTFHVYIYCRGDGANTNDAGNELDDSRNTYTTFLIFSDSDNDGGSSISRCLTKQQWSVLKVRLASICDALNGHHPEKTTTTSSSLFAVLSKLLLSLNQLQIELRPAKSHTPTPDQSHDRSRLLRPMTDRQRTSHLEGCLRNCRANDLSPCDVGFPGTGVHLAILLLRCAAAGKHRELFSHPFPWFARGGPVAETIWKATEYHQRFQRRRRRLRPPISQETTPNTKQRDAAVFLGSNNESARTSLSTSPTLLPPSEQELLGFLCSLPWMKRGRITVTRNKGRSESEDIRSCDERRILFDVCLHLDATDALEASGNGDASHSPRFARSCRRHGGLAVYHGTQIENAWSILNNGFWNPSEAGNEFVKNGAMMGSGVYVTTSRKVATFFATSNAPARMVRSALKHDSIVHLLSMAGDDAREITSDATDRGANGGLRPSQQHKSEAASFHDSYEVSCFPVFEARIVRPPGTEGDGTGGDPSTGLPSRRKKPHDNKNNDGRRNGTDSTSTRRDGKYYVVSDARDIRITKLHLAFELKRTRRATPTGALSRFLPTRLLAPTGIANAPMRLLALFGLAASIVVLWCRGGGTDR
mmetsp:Transcript_8786/g.21450  ORF Transcript_8786/g.21450 Transcript_8786/m.21450 type:complete len:731 (-) Transcript_8786:1774-3966(-)|eukprot:CAMPEP_0197179510 /NCGR_PEP_ID=MMETSP1423-20130617/4425_1 /TAXON_ID=476441 /ORGANISM="Pseudo-nitzschia heimii, Strain UNC1101" /LENGTH=730 /DNA_ID=CAMNT_0042629421 /DNA_START=47 /DNA_END=2239 /DNA_ORIENTATION=+